MARRKQILVIGFGKDHCPEMAYRAAYHKQIPIVVVKGTGGVPDRLVDTYIDDRKTERILGENTPERAVETAFTLIEQKGRARVFRPRGVRTSPYSVEGNGLHTIY